MRAALVLLVACRVSLLAPAGARVSCDADSVCPAPLVCQTTQRECVAVRDDTPPTIIGAISESETGVALSFSEAMNTSEAASVRIEPTLAVVATTWQADARTLHVVTSAQQEGTSYTLTVSDVHDTAANPLSAQTQFVGYTSVIDPAPPATIGPKRGSTWLRVDGDPVLSWTARSGAQTYTVEVAASADFASLIFSAVIDAPSTTASVANLTVGAVYWRVRVGAAGTPSATSDFDLIDDTFFVRCADSEDCADTSVTQTGGITRPFRKVASAVDVSLVLAARAPAIHPIVRVASRASGYSESLDIDGGPLALLGGYGGDFSSRDIDGNRTLVTGGATTLSLHSLTAAVTIEGFALAAHPPTGGIGIVADLSDVGDELALRHCSLTMSSLQASVGTGARLSAGHGLGPLFSHVDVTVADSTTAMANTGIEIDASPFRGDTLTVHGGSGQQTMRGLLVNGPLPADVVISNATIVAGSSLALSGQSWALDVSNNQQPSVGEVRVDHSVIISGPAGNDASALHMHNGARVIIDEATLQSSDAATHFAAPIVVDDCDGLVLTNSVVVSHVSVASGGTAAAIYKCRTILNGNTFVAGPAAGAQGLQLDTAGGPTGTIIAANNLVAVQSSSDTCVVTSNNPSLLSFEHNAFVNCATLFSSSTTYGAANTLDTALDGSLVDPSCVGTCAHRRAGGSVAVAQPLSAIFVDPSADFRLLSSPATLTLRTSGVTGDALVCGSQEQPASCGGTLTDRDGGVRSTPFSIGAYQIP